MIHLPVQVLLVEDNDGDAQLVCELMHEADAAWNITRVERLSDLPELIHQTEFECALLDLSLPDAHGLQTLAVFMGVAPGIPVVVLTGLDDETTALKAMRHGARDYLRKDELTGTLLARTLQHAIERKRTEIALASSEQRYRRIFEHSRDGLFISGVDGVILDVNEALAAIYGYTRAELLGLDARQLYADHARREVMLAALHAHGAIVDFATEGLRKDGSRVDILLSATLEHGASGATFLQGSIRDVTDQVCARKALEASEERFRSLANSAPIGIWLTDAHGAWIYHNNQMASIAGWAQDAIGFGWVESVHADDREWVWNAWRTFATGVGVTSEEEFRFTRPDGTVRWVRSRAAAIYNAGSELQGFAGTTEDITDSKMYEEKLDQARREFQAIVDLSPVPIIVADERRIIQVWNRAAEHTFGWTAEEILGQPYPLSSVTGAADEVEEVFNAAFGAEPAAGLEIVRRTKDGTLKTLQLWNAPLRIRDDAQLSVGILVDVTERKQLEDQLRQSQKMEAVGRLAGGIAHDFNNILTAMGGHIDLILSEVREHDPLRADLNEVATAVKRAADLTHQLLAFSRSQVLLPQPVNVNAVIADLERMLRRIIGEDIDLVTSLADNIGTVLVDRGQLEQVLVNLVVNARDAMPNGGRLSVQTCVFDADHEGLTKPLDLPDGPCVTITVSDTGEGMDEHTQARIFEPFFTTKEHGKGTGLGLSTVYGIIKQSRGDIQVHSQKGCGTVFRIFLPVVDMVPVPVAPAPAKVAATGTETVLLIEDDPAVRGLVKRLLRKRGYTVLDASSAAHARDYCRTHEGKIHLLLSDVVMPEIAGPALAEELRALRPEMRVLFMSGYTADTIFTQGILADSSAFISKPFSADSLYEHIGQVLHANSR